MYRFAITCVVALLMTASADISSASAQPQVPGGGGGRPTFSPYLNLLGGGFGGRSPALNYLGIVRPQQQLNQQFGQIQQQLTNQNQQINQAIQATEESLLPPTGNVAVFNNTGTYFNRIPGVSSGGSGFGTAGGFNRSLGGGAGGMGNQPSFSKPQSGSRSGASRR